MNTAAGASKTLFDPILQGRREFSQMRATIDNFRNYGDFLTLPSRLYGHVIEDEHALLLSDFKAGKNTFQTIQAELLKYRTRSIEISIFERVLAEATVIVREFVRQSWATLNIEGNDLRQQSDRLWSILELEHVLGDQSQIMHAFHNLYDQILRQLEHNFDDSVKTVTSFRSQMQRLPAPTGNHIAQLRALATSDFFVGTDSALWDNSMSIRLWIALSILIDSAFVQIVNSAQRFWTFVSPFMVASAVNGTSHVNGERHAPYLNAEDIEHIHFWMSFLLTQSAEAIQGYFQSSLGASIGGQVPPEVLKDALDSCHFLPPRTNALAASAQFHLALRTLSESVLEIAHIQPQINDDNQSQASLTAMLDHFRQTACETVSALWRLGSFLIVASRH